MDDLPVTRLELERIRNTQVSAVMEIISPFPDIELYEFMKAVVAGEEGPDCRNTVRALAAIALFDELLRRFEVRELEAG